MVQCQITFKEALQRESVHSEKQQALTRVLDCPLEDIHVVEQQQNDNQVTFAMPPAAFDRLCSLGDSGDPALEELGILRGKEILETPHNLERIRLMLSKMFRDEDLRTFCRKHFPAVLDDASPEIKNSALLEALLEHASQTSRIPHILVLANQYNPELFQKYEDSLYYHPRMFPSRKPTRPTPVSSNFRPVFFNLSAKDVLQASLAGTGIATGLMFLLQKVMMLVTDAFLSYLLMGAILLLGMLVGETVLKATNFKRGQLLAFISVGCYLLGSILGNSLAFLSSIGFSVPFSAFGQVIAAGVGLTVSNGLAALIGIILAYRTAR